MRRHFLFFFNENEALTLPAARNRCKRRTGKKWQARSALARTICYTAATAGNGTYGNSLFLLASSTDRGRSRKACAASFIFKENVMYKWIAIAACALSLAACGSMSGHSSSGASDTSSGSSGTAGSSSSSTGAGAMSPQGSGSMPSYPSGSSSSDTGSGMSGSGSSSGMSGSGSISGSGSGAGSSSGSSSQ
jgi:hypothetical protein